MPLSLILLAQDYDFRFLDTDICWDVFSKSAGCVLPFYNPYYSIVFVVICLFCFSVTLLTLAVVRAKRQIQIKKEKYISTELMNYALPYVVAFMSIDYQEVGKFVGFSIFLVWMFWITYKAEQVILNPVLIAFGWKLYEISYVFPGGDAIHTGTALTSIAVKVEDYYYFDTIQRVLVIKAKVKEE
jgi:hypothetical protein